MTRILTQADVSARLRRYLDRRTMPRNLDGKPEAQQDEVRGLVAVISRYAACPLGEWWQRFEQALDEALETRAWPTSAECAKAAKGLAPSVSGPGAVWEADEAAIWASRITGNGPVSDSALWGRLAAEVLHRRLATLADMEPWRQRHAERLRDVYGAERAAEYLAGLAQRNESAMELGGRVVRRQMPALEARRMPGLPA